MHQLNRFKIWILLALVSYTLGNDTENVKKFSKYRVMSNDRKENWHTDSIRPSMNYEPTIVSTTDFYLKEISKQLMAINKKIDRAMIRLIGSTVKGDDNDENIERARYSNFTQPNCETLINVDTPSGIYNFPSKSSENFPWIWNIFEIYCDQSFGGGWTVVQRREDSSSSRINFTNKCWDDYAKGFGDLSGEFWLGNEWIHRLTTLFGPYELRIEFEDSMGHKSWAQYSEFTVSSHRDNYRLKIDGYTVGNYTDSSISNNSTEFTNKNLRYDLVNLDHACTMDFHGTWWHPDNCIGANLNGDYYKNTKMMIRSRNNRYVDLANNTGK